MVQLRLDLSLKEQYNEHDFIVTTANQDAFTAVCNPDRWPDNRILIIGENGSGKSHLSSIFKARFGAKSLDIMRDDVSHFVIENIDEDIDEDRLFHAMNFAVNNSISLLMTASSMPEIDLVDLRSRISATKKCLIHSPDTELMRAIIMKMFADRQISMQSDVLEYVLTNSERSYEFIRTFVSDVENSQLKKGQALTIPFVKSLGIKELP